MPDSISLDRVFQFKITLQGVKPAIWRRILVPPTYTFWDLHVAIQDAMGWEDYHLHAFRVPHPSTGVVTEIGIPVEDDMGGENVTPGWETRVSDWMKPGAIVAYEYDFGDGWVHELKFELVKDREEGLDYPACVAGERACPIEDSGGVWGYQDMLSVLADPKHEDHASTREWLGEDFDPAHFDPTEVQFDDPKERWDFAFGDE
ncbi:MAG: plasmid pRiA4b ORF-3 family protein [Rhodothermales bacterium]